MVAISKAALKQLSEDFARIASSGKPMSSPGYMPPSFPRRRGQQALFAVPKTPRPRRPSFPRVRPSRAKSKAVQLSLFSDAPRRQLVASSPRRVIRARPPGNNPNRAAAMGKKASKTISNHKGPAAIGAVGAITAASVARSSGRPTDKTSGRPTGMYGY